MSVVHSLVFIVIHQCFGFFFFTEFIAKSLIVQKNNIVGWNKDFISRFACKFEKEFNGIGIISSPYFKKAIQQILCGSYKQQTTLGESAINVQLYMKYFKLNRPLNDYQMNRLMDTMQKSTVWSHLKLIELQMVDVLTALDVSMDRTFHFGFKNAVNIHHDEVLMSLLDAQPICMPKHFSYKALQIFIDFISFVQGREVVICVRLLIRQMQPGNVRWMGHFNGYIISLLVLYYFQTRGELPAVELMQSGARQNKCGGVKPFFSTSCCMKINR